MKIAVIDLGTNTFNLLIAKVEGKNFTPLYVTKEFVKLGEGGINEGIIQATPFERGIQTLLDYKLQADQYDCEKVVAIATSAIRNAKNGLDFVQKVKQVCNIDITTIDGTAEANLIYRGTLGAMDIPCDVSLIIDVGGGSTEFIICSKDKLIWKKSVEVGVTRLFELFHHEDPISIQNKEALESHLNTILVEVIAKAQKHQVSCLIGSSGAFTSLASMILHSKNKSDELKGKTSFTFELGDYFSIHHLLLQSTLNQRLKINGLIKERAPMIVVGSLLVNFILKKLNIQNFKLSRYSLKEGVAISIANGEKIV